MIDATFPADLDALAGMDLEDQLDVLLSVADGDELAYCEQCGQFVPLDESVPASADPADDTRLCGVCAELRDEADHSLEAINAQMAAHAAAMERERAAMPMPDGLDGVPF